MTHTLPFLLFATTLFPATPPAPALTIAVVNRADDTVSMIDSETGATKTLPTGKGRTKRPRAATGSSCRTTATARRPATR